jgi:hypothetical protein
MGNYHKSLFLVALMLAVASAGCSIPGMSPKGNDPGAYLPISPTPTVTPSPSPTPSPTPEPTVAAHNTVATPTSGDYSHTYVWEYKNVEWRFTAIVQKAKYDQFKAKPHSADMGFVSYAMSGEDRDLIDSAIAQIRQGGSKYGFSRYDEAVNLITFVQSIPYVDDHPTGSPRYPLETLAEVQGDCKDKSVLAAALLHEAGFDVALLSFSSTPERTGHIALGINTDASGTSFTKDGIRYYYVEMTSPDWAIGEVPEELKGAVADVKPVVKNPGLQVTMTATVSGQAAGLVDYKVQYTVTNPGPGTVKHLGLKVHAMALSQGDNVIWAPEQTIDLGDLAEGQSFSGDILVTIPLGETSRIVGIASGENADRVSASTDVFVAGASAGTLTSN